MQDNEPVAIDPSAFAQPAMLDKGIEGTSELNSALQEGAHATRMAAQELSRVVTDLGSANLGGGSALEGSAAPSLSAASESLKIDFPSVQASASASDSLLGTASGGISPSTVATTGLGADSSSAIAGLERAIETLNSTLIAQKSSESVGSSSVQAMVQGIPASQSNAIETIQRASDTQGFMATPGFGMTPMGPGSAVDGQRFHDPLASISDPASRTLSPGYYTPNVYTPYFRPSVQGNSEALAEAGFAHSGGMGGMSGIGGISPIQRSQGPIEAISSLPDTHTYDQETPVESPVMRMGKGLLAAGKAMTSGVGKAAMYTGSGFFGEPEFIASNQDDGKIKKMYGGMQGQVFDPSFLQAAVQRSDFMGGFFGNNAQVPRSMSTRDYTQENERAYAEYKDTAKGAIIDSALDFSSTAPALGGAIGAMAMGTTGAVIGTALGSVAAAPLNMVSSPFRERMSDRRHLASRLRGAIGEQYVGTQGDGLDTTGRLTVDESYKMADQVKDLALTNKQMFGVSDIGRIVQAGVETGSFDNFKGPQDIMDNLPQMLPAVQRAMQMRNLKSVEQGVQQLALYSNRGGDLHDMMSAEMQQVNLGVSQRRSGLTFSEARNIEGQGALTYMSAGLSGNFGARETMTENSVYRAMNREGQFSNYDRMLFGGDASYKQLATSGKVGSLQGSFGSIIAMSSPEMLTSMGSGSMSISDAYSGASQALGEGDLVSNMNEFRYNRQEILSENLERMEDTAGPMGMNRAMLGQISSTASAMGIDISQKGNFLAAASKVMNVDSTEGKAFASQLFSMHKNPQVMAREENAQIIEGSLHREAAKSQENSLSNRLTRAKGQAKEGLYEGVMSIGDIAGMVELGGLAAGAMGIGAGASLAAALAPVAVVAGAAYVANAATGGELGKSVNQFGSAVSGTVSEALSFGTTVSDSGDWGYAGRRLARATGLGHRERTSEDIAIEDEMAEYDNVMTEKNETLLEGVGVKKNYLGSMITEMFDTDLASQRADLASKRAGGGVSGMWAGGLEYVKTMASDSVDRSDTEYSTIFDSKGDILEDVRKNADRKALLVSGIDIDALNRKDLRGVSREDRKAATEEAMESLGADSTKDLNGARSEIEKILASSDSATDEATVHMVKETLERYGLDSSDDGVNSMTQLVSKVSGNKKALRSIKNAVVQSDKVSKALGSSTASKEAGKSKFKSLISERIDEVDSRWSESLNEDTLNELYSDEYLENIHKGGTELAEYMESTLALDALEAREGGYSDEEWDALNATRLEKEESAKKAMGKRLGKREANKLIEDTLNKKDDGIANFTEKDFADAEKFLDISGSLKQAKNVELRMGTRDKMKDVIMNQGLRSELRREGVRISGKDLTSAVNAAVETIGVEGAGSVEDALSANLAEAGHSDADIKKAVDLMKKSMGGSFEVTDKQLEKIQKSNDTVGADIGMAITELDDKGARQALSGVKGGRSKLNKKIKSDNKLETVESGRIAGSQEVQTDSAGNVISEASGIQSGDIKAEADNYETVNDLLANQEKYTQDDYEKIYRVVKNKERKAKSLSAEIAPVVSGDKSSADLVGKPASGSGSPSSSGSDPSKGSLDQAAKAIASTGSELRSLTNALTVMVRNQQAVS